MFSNISLINKQLKMLFLFCWHQTFISWPCFLLHLQPMQVVFGSLYRDDVLIKPSRVVNILAAACMLQLVSMSSVKNNITSDSLKTYNYSIMQTIAFPFPFETTICLPFHDHVHGFLWIANQKMFVNSSCQLLAT